MVRYAVCFYCNREYTGPAKISTRDNTTKICSQCAELEGLHDFLIQNIQQSTEAVLQTLYQLLALHKGAVGV
jgi:hypothetical protein